MCREANSFMSTNSRPSHLFNLPVAFGSTSQPSKKQVRSDWRQGSFAQPGLRAVGEYVLPNKGEVLIPDVDLVFIQRRVELDEVSSWIDVNAFY